MSMLVWKDSDSEEGGFGILEIRDDLDEGEVVEYYPVEWWLDDDDQGYIETETCREGWGPDEMWTELERLQSA